MGMSKDRSTGCTIPIGAAWPIRIPNAPSLNLNPAVGQQCEGQEEGLRRLGFEPVAEDEA
jgi:hypothetical protein